VTHQESIHVYAVVFYKIDKDDMEILNEKGDVKLWYENINHDISYLADDVDPTNLMEFK
jgi:hypothetical protein